MSELQRLRESLHDLIAPLSAVVGFSDLLLDEDATEEDAGERTDRARYHDARPGDDLVRSVGH